MRLLTDSEEEGLLDLLVPGFGRLRGRRGRQGQAAMRLHDTDREAAMDFYIRRS